MGRLVDIDDVILAIDKLKFVGATFGRPFLAEV